MAELCLPKNGSQQARPDGFPGVHGNDRTASIWMPHDVMAAFNANGFETQSMQRFEKLLASEGVSLAHASTQMR
jgi:hypothetical protein